jgi:ketosteroid isomerase-like protein
MSAQGIENRLRRLEDVQEIQALMARYHQATDGWTDHGTHRDPAAIAALFTDDGEWDVTDRTPPPAGRAEIESLAAELHAAVPWIIHTVLNPIVDVDGDAATGEFKGLLRVRPEHDGRLAWSVGVYRLTARRTNDGWRIQRLRWEPVTDASPFSPAGPAQGAGR